MTDTSKKFRDIYFRTRDGLRLYGRHYSAAVTKLPKHRPALCLAGLTRNSRDFHDLALAMSSDANHPRDVYTLDMRGRGYSDHDDEWKNYNIILEAQDIIEFMTMSELSDAALIGTSRGGLITMVLAALQPSRIGCAILNDIDPVIDTEGLLRIASYVGNIPRPKTWAEATSIVMDLVKTSFPKMTEADAEEFARQLFNEEDGRPVNSYDPNLAKSLSALNGEIPPLWPQFDALSNVPVMVIRGANSDLLTPATVDEMKRRHPNMSAITVPDEGHAPLLKDKPTQLAIMDFLRQADANTRNADVAVVA